MQRLLMPLWIVLCSVLVASCDLPQPLTLQIVHDTLSVERGSRIQLFADVTYENEIRIRDLVEWSSSRPQVAKVDEQGRVLGVSVGETTIRARKSNLSQAVKVVVVGATNLLPANTVRVHYYREDKNCAGWGLHLFGSAVEKPTTWPSPLLFATTDAYGCALDIPVTKLDGTFTFLVHKVDEKDGISERTLSGFQTVREFWLKQGRSEVWTAQPSLAPEFVYAEFKSANEIRAVLSADTQVNLKDLSFQDDLGKGLPVASLATQGREVAITLGTEVDFSRNWRLSFAMGSQWVRLSGALLDSEFHYDGQDLGATLRSRGDATLKLWSPPATAVSVRLFDSRDANRSVGTVQLSRGDLGVWSATLSPRTFGLRTLEGVFYQYDVTAFGATRAALDPYARSMAAFSPAGNDSVGKAAIVDPSRASPRGFDDLSFANNGIMKNRADMVAYEIHVRDFTSDPQSGVSAPLRGTYLGFIEKIPYLKSLGITHVQFLPIQNYYTVNESDRAFRDSAAKSQNYNWGYDPHNYFTPEGWFSTDANNPYSRITEYKSLVKALHEQGIGVIMDVVYNHAYKPEIFEPVCPGCYFRQDNAGHIAATSGAGPSLESRRLMTRKLIIDSLKYFVDEYHVNGFRFDLMGFTDDETMREIRKTLGDDVILHGEAWEFTDLPSGGVTKSNLPAGSEVAAFADTTRDSFAGRMENAGFVQGANTQNPRVRSGIIGNLSGYNTDYDGNGLPNVRITEDSYDRFARSPVENLGFLTIHDGFTLWDKINLSYKGTTVERARLLRMSYAMLLTSQGRVILHGGDEIARTKPLATNDPYPDRARTSENVTEDADLPGVVTFHENSYSSSDYTNMFRWGRLNSALGRALFDYTKGLIALKRNVPLFRQTSTEDVNASLRFLGDQEVRPTTDDSEFAGYKSFAEVPSLTVHFVNGPASSTLYLAGEVYPQGFDKNPTPSRFPIEFDAQGNATVEFVKADIEKFDLSAWSDPGNLQFKAVKAAGGWDIIPGTYSGMGNNSVRPNLILRDNSVTVNLAIIDHSPGVAPIVENPLIAFELNSKQASGFSPKQWSPVAQVSFVGGENSARERFVVIHNASKNEEKVEIPALGKASDWVVLVDNDQVDFVRGVSRTDVRFVNGMVVVPRQSTTVLARRWQFR